MTPRRGRTTWFSGAALLLLASALASLDPAAASEIDAAASQVGFSLHTRWGQQLEGRFPTVRGVIDDLGEGRHRVRLVLSTRDVEIVGHSGYTRFTRGHGFFDSEHWPQAEFLSDSYPQALLREGGTLGGTLRMRGVQRREVFVVQPATCDRPGRDCDVVATGQVQRGDYGMDRWRVALGADVHFSMHVRLRADPAP